MEKNFSFMIKKHLIIIGALVTMAGCQTSNQPVLPADEPEIITKTEKEVEYNNEFGYGILIPSTLSETGSWLNSFTKETGPFFGTEIDRAKNPPLGEQDTSVLLHHLQACSLTPHHMEAIQSTNVSTWGKVVYKPSNDPAGNENDVFCPPLPPATAAYAFCAEKDGKAVAICIQQMTDNPALAKEIFESFKWTE